MGCNSSGTQLRRYEAFISNTRLRQYRNEDHGSRSGVREACEPAQRVLDDLVQGHPVLLLQRGVPAQVRLQAGALPRACARTAPKPSRVVTVVSNLRDPPEVRPFTCCSPGIQAGQPRYSKLRRASAGGIRDARIAGLAVARTAPRNAMPPRRSSLSHGMTKAAWLAKKRRYRSYDKATPKATPKAIPVSAMNESSIRNDRRTIDLRKPRARRAPVSCRRSTTLRIVMTPRPAMPTIRPRARYASKRLNTPIVASRIWLMTSWVLMVMSWYATK